MTHYTYYAFKLLDCIAIWKLLSGPDLLRMRNMYGIETETDNKNSTEHESLERDNVTRETIPNNDTAFHAKINHIISHTPFFPLFVVIVSIEIVIYRMSSQIS